MTAHIHWNTLPPQDWQKKFAQLPSSNLLQSYEYALAICPLKRQKGRWGVIVIDGREAGLVQILEVSLLGKAIHALAIDRGPLWFEGYGSLEHLNQFLCALLKQFPRRMGRKYRIIPEMEQSPALDNLMSACGFQKNGKPYETIILDLKQDQESLRAGLKKNWRGALSKAEKQESLNVDWAITTLDFKIFLQDYAADKAAKGYGGPSVELLTALVKSFLSSGKVRFGRAIKDGQAIASVLLLKHGIGATYQVGWCSDVGRQLGAQNLLLWHAMLELKNDGITELDLGGINDDTAKGVKKFKEAMGGRIVRLGALYA